MRNFSNNNLRFPSGLQSSTQRHSCLWLLVKHYEALVYQILLYIYYFWIVKPRSKNFLKVGPLKCYFLHSDNTIQKDLIVLNCVLNGTFYRFFKKDCPNRNISRKLKTQEEELQIMLLVGLHGSFLLSNIIIDIIN